VIVATNALTGPLVPRLASTIVPLESAQIATAPLPPALRAALLPGAACASDTRRSLLYFRLAPDGSLVLGGRGSFWGRTGPGGFDRLRRHAITLFPALADADWPHRWSGRVAMTLDHVPHVHRLAPGLTAALGFNGRGIAMATALGAALAAEVAGGAARLPDHPLRPVPLHAFHRLGVALVGTWYQLRDRAETRPARKALPVPDRRKTAP
jgi:glycine/D-amino acid oxidase-like deaminating enzyme